MVPPAQGSPTYYNSFFFIKPQLFEYTVISEKLKNSQQILKLFFFEAKLYENQLVRSYVLILGHTIWIFSGPNIQLKIKVFSI